MNESIETKVVDTVQMSENIANIAEALCLAQSELESAKKD